MILDGIVLVIVLFSTLIALFRGFIREMFTIMNVVAATAAAVFVSPHLSPAVLDMLVKEGEEVEKQRVFGILPVELAADGIAYAGLFIFVMIVMSIVSHFAAKPLENAGMGALDRTLGAIFGLVRAILVIAVLYLPFYMLVDKEQRDDWFSESRSHGYVETSAEFLAGLLPEQATDSINETVEDVQKGATADAVKKMQEMGILKELEKIQGENGNLSSEEIEERLRGVIEDGNVNLDEMGYDLEQIKGLQKLIEEEYNTNE